MFRQITALVFMMAFVTQTFSAPFMMLYYYSNINDYAKKCINKAKPAMHCNGKCQVMKKIKAAEKKEQQSQQRKQSPKTETLSSRSFYCTVAFVSNSLDKPTTKESNIDFTRHPKDFFHPPQC